MRPLFLSRVLHEELRGATEGIHTPVMLWGPPGVGKSDMIRQTGARAGEFAVEDGEQLGGTHCDSYYRAEAQEWEARQARSTLSEAWDGATDS